MDESCLLFPSLIHILESLNKKKANTKNRERKRDRETEKEEGKEQKNS